MPLKIVRGDITLLRADAMVNAANTMLGRGGGVCGAIFRAAGERELEAACAALAPIKTGEAVVTPGFGSPAKYIIHTAGPIYRGGGFGEQAALRACYLNSLALADAHSCESVAFPLISAGIYGYPKREALRVALDAIREYLRESELSVTLVLRDRQALAANDALLGAVGRYISARFEDGEISAPPLRSFAATEKAPAPIMPLAAASAARVPPPAQAAEVRLDALIEMLDEPFSTTLMRLIDARGEKDSDVYRRANIDRRLFSKIRSNAHYVPGKTTVLAFAVALELSLDQTHDLLARAGFALSRSRKLDVIVEYFITNKMYDIYQINEVLFSYDQPLLGG